MKKQNTLPSLPARIRYVVSLAFHTFCQRGHGYNVCQETVHVLFRSGAVCCTLYAKWECGGVRDGTCVQEGIGARE